MENNLNVATMQAPGRLVGPQARIDWLTRAVEKLDGQHVDLVVLPELYLTGYNIGDNVQRWAEEHDGVFSRQIAELSKSHQTAIHFGYAEQHDNQVYNSAACYDKTGVMITHHRKLLLPPGFEMNHFTPGNSYSHFKIGDFRIATLICYDAEFPEAFRSVLKTGCDLVIVPTALGAQWGIVSTAVIPTRAFENGVFVCYANHCEQENGLEYYGGSCIVGPDGKELARATSTDSSNEASNEACLLASLDLAAVKMARDRLPYHVDVLKLPGVDLV